LATNAAPLGKNFPVNGKQVINKVRLEAFYWAKIAG
jgi:hypothetical protein